MHRGTHLLFYQLGFFATTAAVKDAPKDAAADDRHPHEDEAHDEAVRPRVEACTVWGSKRQLDGSSHWLFYRQAPPIDHTGGAIGGGPEGG